MFIIYRGVEYRVSRTETGRLRFSAEDIIQAINHGEAVVSGDRNHCLCRKRDGAVMAEILQRVE